MERYKNLHWWMLVPMAVMQAGIFRDYWGDLAENAWSVHVHYWAATLWYGFLILQPWYATHGRLATHRTNGIVGFFLAGGVAITALSMLHRDMDSAERSARQRELFGPFESWFFYGIAAIEIVMMSAFIVAVIQAIRYRHRLEDHAWWLISTVFIIMMPALARGIQVWWFAVFGASAGGVRNGVYLTTALIVAMTFGAAVKFGRVNHPATWLAVGVNMFNLLYEPLGKWEWLQGVLRATLKG